MRWSRNGSALAVIALAMVLALGACTSNSASTSNVPSATDAPATATQAPAGDAAAAEDGPLTPYDPPIVMPVAFSTSAVQYFPEGDDYENNVWSRLFAEKMGIIFKVAWTADGSTDAYRQKMNVCLASGDLPTIFQGDYTFFRTAVDAGYCTDLTEIWEKYPSERLRKVAEGFDLQFDAMTIDGKLRALPGLDYYEQKGTFLWIREDWLKELNLQPPKTMDEMIAVARAFKEANLSSSGSTVPIGLQGKLFQFDFGSITGFASAFGVPERQDGQYFRDDSGKIQFAGVQPHMKDVLSLLQGLYKEGLIDPEFGTKDLTALEEDVNQGRVGMAFGAEWNSWWPYAAIWQSDKVLYKPYAVPAMDGYEVKMGVPFPGANSDSKMVFSGYDHPEAVIKVLNFAREISNENSSDEIYEIYDKREQWRFVPISWGPPGEMLWYPYYETAYKTGDESGIPQNYMIRYNLIKDFMATGNPEGQGLYGQVGPESTLSIIYNDYKPNNKYVISPIAGTRPDSLTQLSASLEKIELQAFTEIIQGASIENFDKFVTDWYAAGGQKILDELNEMYPAK